MIDYTECIKALCSKLGIDVISEPMRKNDTLRYEIHHTAKFLGNYLDLDLAAWSLPVSAATKFLSKLNPMIGFKPIVGYGIHPFEWIDCEGCDNRQSRYMLECVITSSAFKIADRCDFMIGNPFYCKFQLLDCTSDEEFFVCLDLLAIDTKDKNIKLAKQFKSSVVY